MKIHPTHKFFIFTHSTNGAVVKFAFGTLSDLVTFDPGAASEVTIDIVASAETRSALLPMARTFNLPGAVKSTGKRLVHCVETGQTWESASATALAIGVSQSSLWQHLSGNLKYPTILKRHYRYGMPITHNPAP